MKLNFDSVSYAYPASTSVFTNNSLELVFDEHKKYNLYGIIGPSGTGKTTFISLIGGQLKPDTGTITINDTDIYTVDDSVRRSLIALQMQASTALRGDVRYNITFGLPTESSYAELFGEALSSQASAYSDEELIEVLNYVGLWNLFEQKKGLETLIGENGLTLSGGQKQRLNFANLYLRSQYYKPKIIMIDEPTSSLDEISENTITDLILELSQSALVLVVAHRIKTLTQAVGLFDSSLIQPNATLDFYTPEKLHILSPYYAELLDGKAFLDQE